MRTPIPVLALSGLGLLLLAGALAGGARSGAQALTNCDVDAGLVALQANELQFIAILNDARADNGRAPLAVSPNLTRAAAWMANDMVENVGLAHVDSHGRQPWTRAFDCGYPTLGVGENASATGPDAAHTFWMFTQSPEHLANMMSENWTVIGVGEQGGYWSVKFGSYDDSDEPPVTPDPTNSPTLTATATATATATGTPPATMTPTATATPAVSPTPTPHIHRSFAPLAAKAEQ